VLNNIAHLSMAEIEKLAGLAGPWEY
jgi:hypothetical protein